MFSFCVWICESETTLIWILTKFCLQVLDKRFGLIMLWAKLIKLFKILPILNVKMTIFLNRLITFTTKLKLVKDLKFGRFQ